MGSAGGAIRARWRRATLASPWPHTPPTNGPAQTPATRDLLLDVGIAVAVFAGTVALLAVGESEAGDQLDLVGLLLCAVASLPLIARRRAPVLVFVLTGLASVALRLAADPVGPPLGPTLALYWMVAAGDAVARPDAADARTRGHDARRARHRKRARHRQLPGQRGTVRRAALERCVGGCRAHAAAAGADGRARGARGACGT